MGVFETFRLDGKTALVTGGSKGLGRAMAQALAEAGADIALCSRNAGEAEQAAQEIADATGRRAAGFYADVPDLRLVCDGVRVSGNHAVYLWTFTGTHAATKRELTVRGWEEWDLDEAGLIETSRGNFDVDDYSRQTGI